MEITFAILAITATLVIAQDVSSLPPCGQTCIYNMIGIAEADFGCAPGDVICYCTDPNFGYGIRDCAVQACPPGVDINTVIKFGLQYCQSAIASVASTSSTPTSTASAASTPTASAPSAPTISIPATSLPTTLVTTTDSAGNIFTVTGEILVSGTSTTTVPCRTVITTDAAGETVTRTETGSSVLPTELQGQNSASQAVTASVTASSSLTASPSIATVTTGAGARNLSYTVPVMLAVFVISTLVLVLL